MLTKIVSAHKFPGAVPALLTWADGDSEYLADLVASFCAEVPQLVRSLSREAGAGNSQAVCRAAQHLQGKLVHVGVPELGSLAATIEDLGRTRDLGAAAPLVDELEVILDGLCAYLAKKPWIR